MTSMEGLIPKMLVSPNTPSRWKFKKRNLWDSLTLARVLLDPREEV